MPSKPGILVIRADSGADSVVVITNTEKSNVTATRNFTKELIVMREQRNLCSIV